MTIEIKAPVFPESVADGTIATWHKRPGEPVQRDELLVDIETDKVVLEVVAPQDGSLADIVKDEGEVVLSNQVIAHFEPGAAAAISVSGAPAAASQPSASVEAEARLSPAARKLLEERGIAPEAVTGTGRGGMVTKEDVLAFLAVHEKPAVKPEIAVAPAEVAVAVARGTAAPVSGARPEKRVPMTRMRARIAERLLGASQNTAMLTTFNEANMQPIMDLRRQYRDMFEQKHGTRLGFMGFFVKAVTEALKRFPVVNASIDGDDIVYHGYQDIGIAVSTDKGLVVPILRDTDYMTIADIEIAIGDFSQRARDGKLAIEDMQGGTFTITNGGVFGSLLSTPILNPPQSAILGMHKIQERPVVENGQVVVRPMMYLALSYDHRLVDGKDSVQFLVTVKDMLEAPARMLLDI